MKRRSRYVAALAALLLISSTPADAALKVVKIYDGDTITMADGLKVRLLQIDAPELAEGECYADKAKATLVSLLSKKGVITLKADPVSASFDRYGRALRYIFVGKVNVNLEMVKQGAAAPYFYQGEKGKYSAAMLKAAEAAKYYKVGLWKDCPGTQLIPTKAITTYKAVGTPVGSPVNIPIATTGCDPNYAGCIPLYPPDLNCSDI
ncbi:MAG: thermonuclease family protein, partial [Candidatus Nanopelagicaceae bacterium]|nr:thermonuclease family protein [Candidatus Nanopelagicaceae bacterium]